MPIDVELYSDLFTRANANPIGAPWRTSNGANNCQIVSDAVEGTATAAYNGVNYNGSAPNDQYSECSIAQLLSGDTGPFVRQSLSAQTYYYLSIPAALGSVVTATLKKVVAGVSTTIATANVFPNVDDDFKLEVIGTALACYQNGLLFLQATDSSIASGYYGFKINNPASLGDIQIGSWDGGSASLGITQEAVENFDGTVGLYLTVPFTPAPVPVGSLARQPNFSYGFDRSSVSSTGGTLLGHTNYYYYFVAIDVNGNWSIVSGAVEVVIPNNGVNTNQITITDANPFDPNAVAYLVFCSVGDPWQPLLVQTATAVPTGSSFSFTDTGLLPIDQLPPSQSLIATRLYWRKTGDVQWTLGAVTHTPLQSALTFQVPLNIQGQSIDIQLRSLGAQNNGTWETPASFAPIATYVVQGITPSEIIIGGYPGGSPVPITTGGSIPPALPQATFTYTSTTTQIIISWAAFTIYRADGSTTAVGSGSITINSLTAGTTYYFYPYWSDASSAMEFATGGTGSNGSPAAAYSSNSAIGAAIQNYQQNVACSSGAITAATPASGSGGGGTGGGGTNICVRSTMLVETLERGVVPASTVQVGEFLKTRGHSGWTEVVKIRRARQSMWIRVETAKNKSAVQITPTHHIITCDSEEEGCEAQKLSLNRFLFVKDGYDTIAQLSALNEEAEKLSISCEPIKMFYAGENGPDILVHNTRLNS